MHASLYYDVLRAGRMKWNKPSLACSGFELKGVVPSSPRMTKLYSPDIRARTGVLSNIGLTFSGAVLVYSKDSPGLRMG